MSQNNPFKSIEKLASQSFHQNKKLIKRVLSGESLSCSQCKQMITVDKNEHDKQLIIQCPKGCTSIQLDYSE